MGSIRKKKNKKKIIILIIIFVVLILLGFLAYKMFKSDFKIKSFKNIIVINYKSKYKDNYGEICYGNVFSCDKVKVKSDGKVDTSKLGKYKVKYTLTSGSNKKNISQVVEVKDTEKPKLEIEDKIAYVCPKDKKVQKIKMKATDNYDGDLTEKIETKFKDDKVIVSIKDSSGNKTTKNLETKVEDKEAPVITVNGQKTVYVSVGSTYTDEGASAIDNCDGEIKVDVNNSVDTSKEGVYTVIYTAKDSSGNEAKEQREVKVITHEDGYRTVYLTFDDGPSAYTYDLLDTLKRYGVKVTFFVTGNGPDDAIKRAYDEGHTIALHTATHVYKTIYASVDAYFNDLNTVSNRVKNITGIETKYVRFPGGSSNAVSYNRKTGAGVCMSVLTKELEARGYKYFDWNVSVEDNGSCSSKKDKRSCMLNNYTTYLKKNRGNVVLMHDIKSYTADNLEEMIIYGINNGFTFKQIDDSAPTAHHGTKC